MANTPDTTPENISSELAALTVPIKELKPRKRNARRGDLELIKESLHVNGQYRPIVVNKRNGEVLAGNHTLAAAKALGWKNVAATYVDATDEQAARIVLVDNRANDVSTYDDQLLVDLLKDFEDLSGTGFTTADITTLLQELGATAAKEGATDPDDAPEVPDDADVITQPGDIIQLGDHYLICGDSTDPDVVNAVMGGRTADLLLTDPPYGVNYGDKNKRLNQTTRGNRIEKDIANDDITGADLIPFLEGAFLNANRVMEQGAPYYVFHPEWYRVQFETALLDSNYMVKQTLIWAKHHFVLGRQDYQWKHEPILYGWKPGAAHKWYGAFDKTTILSETETPSTLSKDELVKLVQFIHDEINTSVIKCDFPKSSKLHPTMKPVELLEKLISNSSQYQDAVLDVFAGSGSTLMACERLGRHSYNVELDPAYCDVIVKRWEAYTLQTAKRPARA